MAYEIIKNQIFGETRIESFAGRNNIKMFPAANLWYETIIKQNINTTDCTSDFYFEVWAHYQPDEIIKDVFYDIRNAGGNYASIQGYCKACTSLDSNGVSKGSGDGSENGIISALLFSGDTATDEFTDSTGKKKFYRNIKGIHDVNGVFRVFQDNTSSTRLNASYTSNLGFSTKIYTPFVRVSYFNEFGEETDWQWAGGSVGNAKSYSVECEPLVVNKGVVANTATDFTDEENAFFSYTPQTLNHFIYDPSDSWGTQDGFIRPDTITSLQAALSLNGVSPDLIGYRDIPINGTNYTFNFTEQDRLNIQAKVQGASIVPVYYLIKTVRKVSLYASNENVLETAEHITATKRTLTIVGCNPTLNPVVKDIKEETLALTGSADTVIRYESMVEYEINATASKSAEIVSQSVQCGSKTVSDMGVGVIQDVESGTFIFKATDSRNLRVEQTVEKTLIPYVKPTCYQNLKVEVSSEYGSRATLTVSGSYYNGSFGAVDNTLKLEMRYTNDEGVMGEWLTLSDTPTFNGTTYELSVSIEGFNYSKAYTFQCRATDKLNLAQSSQYELRMYPVFDWGETDFNFNVPVKMDGETVLRHNKDAKNTVLASSGNNVYIRPNGDDDTEGEVQIKTSGDVKVNGGLEVNGNIVVNGKTLTIDDPADYIIATGTEAMGTNGTWKWAKWNSGKAECWGKRNFGNMAITTSWGNLFRSATLDQDLPSGLFSDTPDVININMVNSSFGGWICRHEETAPTAYSTGSFIYVRPASATATPTNIGFHVIGKWN